MSEIFVDRQPLKLFPWIHSTKTVVEKKRIIECSTRIVVDKSLLSMISTKWELVQSKEMPVL